MDAEAIRPGLDAEAARHAKDARDRRKREDLLAGLRLETRLRRSNPPPAARAEEERRDRYDRIAEILRKADEGSPDAGYVDDGTAALLREELARLERAGTTPSPGDDPAPPALTVERFNTILYCRRWIETVRFYRDEIGLPVIADNDWYVEFHTAGESSLSIADSARTPIDDVGGQGITLSWKVNDLAAARSRLVDRALEPSEIRTVWDAIAFYLFDPEGHRIEVWSDAADAAPCAHHAGT
jgi:catechol 2,3-dioxygenase-like lactoylglutathione lyase family enzyme